MTPATPTRAALTDEEKRAEAHKLSEYFESRGLPPIDAMRVMTTLMMSIARTRGGTVPDTDTPEE